MSGYLLAGLSIVALYACGAAFGVSLSAGRWLEMTGLLLVGLGHSRPSESRSATC